MTIVKKAEKARQGKGGKRVFTVLSVSMVLSIMVLAGFVIRWAA